MKKIIGAILAMGILAVSLYAHSGRTNASGCHNDTKSGGYHCH
jgi:hypothetical protein